jgi:hypothetical protein
MGEIKTSAQVKLFVGILTSIPAILPEAISRLTALYGPVDLASDEYPFKETTYYDAEMGKPLHRYFFGFSGLILPAQIAEIKVETNAIEAAMASRFTGVPRPVNLDPGYVELSKIVLASTKNYYHRIYLSLGIYAEVTMHFEAGQWRSFPWTFPDFQSGLYSPYFTTLREEYRRQLKAESRGEA